MFSAEKLKFLFNIIWIDLQDYKNCDRPWTWVLVQLATWQHCSCKEYELRTTNQLWFVSRLRLYSNDVTTTFLGVFPSGGDGWKRKEHRKILFNAHISDKEGSTLRWNMATSNKSGLVWLYFSPVCHGTFSFPSLNTTCKGACQYRERVRITVCYGKSVGCMWTVVVLACRISWRIRRLSLWTRTLWVFRAEEYTSRKVRPFYTNPQ